MARLPLGAAYRVSDGAAYRGCGASLRGAVVRFVVVRGALVLPPRGAVFLATPPEARGTAGARVGSEARGMEGSEVRGMEGRAVQDSALTRVDGSALMRVDGSVLTRVDDSALTRGSALIDTVC